MKTILHDDKINIIGLDLSLSNRNWRILHRRPTVVTDESFVDETCVWRIYKIKS